MQTAKAVGRDSRADAAGLYPLTRRRYVGRLRLDQDTFAAHESNRIEHDLGVEIQFRTCGNVAEQRQGNQRLEQLTPTSHERKARAMGVARGAKTLGATTGAREDRPPHVLRVSIRASDTHRQR
jgi:hypothetical protein